MTTDSHKNAGFTLLELLVVVSILAVVGGLVIVAFDGVQDNAEQTAAETEMQVIAEAVQQFRRDTGYYPKQGLFEHTSATGQGLVDCSAPYSATWLNRKANLSQLFSNPLVSGDYFEDVTHPLAQWNASKARGWHGPYVKEIRTFERVLDPTLLEAGGNPATEGDSLHGYRVPVTSGATPDDAENILPVIVDPWGAPYELYWEDASTLVLHSAGPDGLFVLRSDLIASDDLYLELTP